MYQIPEHLNREYTKGKIVEFLKKQKPSTDNRWQFPHIQVRTIYELFHNDVSAMPGYAQPTFLKIVDEILSESFYKWFLVFWESGICRWVSLYNHDRVRPGSV